MSERVLTPGEKVRKIRKDFKITQSEIAGGKVTRNLISLIENNRTELTNSTARIISDNVNKICTDRHIDFIITPQDLLVNNTIQADKILDDLITEVDNNIDNINYDLSSVAANSEKLIKLNPNLKRIADLYLKLGKEFLNRNDYWQAYVYLFKAYEHFDFKSQQIQLSAVAIELSYTCNKLFKFLESTQIINTVLSLNMNINTSLKYKLTLNKAIAQKELYQYINAIKTLHTLNYGNLDNREFFNVTTLEANCYKELL